MSAHAPLSHTDAPQVPVHQTPMLSAPSGGYPQARSAAEESPGYGIPPRREVRKPPNPLPLTNPTALTLALWPFEDPCDLGQL